MNKMAATFNTKTYAELLSEALPAVIHSEKENQKAVAMSDRLMSKGENNLTPEEDRLFELLVSLVEVYEEKTYPMGKLATPVDSLRTLMEERDLKQKDLADIFGGQPIVSDILNGKREINARPAQALEERFH